MIGVVTLKTSIQRKMSLPAQTRILYVDEQHMIILYGIVKDFDFKICISIINI